MKSSRFVSLATCALLALSTATTNAGTGGSIGGSGGGGSGTMHGGGGGVATVVWVVFGCASGIIFAAYVKNYRHHKELTSIEAQTCGLAYWFNARHP